MYISKYFIYYIIFYLIYQIYKHKDLLQKFKDFIVEEKSNIKRNSDDTVNDPINDTISDTINKSINQEKNEYQIILYKKENKTSRYNLSEIYDNFFNGVKKKLTSDFNINDYKIDISSFKCDKKEIVIFNENLNDIVLDNSNNFIKFDFDSKKNYSYKIKYKLFSENIIKNIKLIIAGKDKRFVYDFREYNIIDGSIKEYGFILDNNIFGDDNIHIYIILPDINIININNTFIEIIEKKINSDNSIIIFDVNSKYYPLYCDEINILEFIEYTDKNNVFFI